MPRRGKDWKLRPTSASSRAAGSGALPAASRPARVELPTSLSTKVQLWNKMAGRRFFLRNGRDGMP
jgi:hypothetical protein